MSGIRSTISLIDNMSNVLNRITGNAAKMDQTIEKTQKTMNKRTSFANNLSKDERALELIGAKYANQARAVERLQQEYLKSIEIKGRYHEATEKIEKKLLDAQLSEMKMADAVEKAGKKLEEQHNQMKNNIETSGNLARRVKQLAGAYISFRGVKRLLRDTVGAAGELNQRVAVMQAAFGNADIGKHYFNRLQLYAIETRNDIEDLTNVTRNFMQLTKNTDKLMGLTDVTNRLSLRTRNLGSAENLIQEAIRGNFTRLQRTLHFTDAQIEPLKQAVQRGSLDGIIGAFDEALNTAGLTDEIVQAFQNSPLQKFHKIFDNLKLNLARAGEEALMKLEPVFDRINQWLTSGNTAAYFNMLGAGIAWTIDGISRLGDIAGSVIGFMRDNAEGLIPVITGIVGGLALWQAIQFGVATATGLHSAILKIHKIRTMEATFAQKAFNLALALNPITMVIMAVLGLIVAITAFGNSSRSVREIFSDAFGAIVTIAQNATNAVIDSVNWMIRQLNKVRGFFGKDAMAEIQYRANWDGFKNKGQDLIENVTIESLMAKYRLDPTTGPIDELIAQENAWNARQLDTLGSIDNTGKKIRDSIDKASEDLKLMRDVAEEKAINRFTTSTLAPQISINFEGDIKETADVDGIVDHIENILTEQLNIAAEGVHE